MTDGAAVQHPSAHARLTPDKPAIVMATSGEVVTYAELEAASNRLARLFRERGLGQGDHVAVLLDNQPAFFHAVWAALRSGLYVTPINWHLKADEAAYIVGDCGARALVAASHLADTVAAFGDVLDGIDVRLAVGGDLPGFERDEDAVASMPATPIDDESEGAWMFYSSGTTGRPKGIEPPLTGAPLGSPTPFAGLLTGLYGFTADTTYLSPAPLYHAAPAGWTTTTQRLGGTTIIMERFDAAQLLELVERHRVSAMQLVPTHIIRLLKLPDDVRTRHDLSSLRMVVHAAAPCPPEIKRAAIEWLGPIVYEYYAGSEGNGFCAIGPEEWLAHPGSVGRSLLGGIHILDEDGGDVPLGEEGVVWFESPSRFEYHGDPEKTKAAWNDAGWSTLGDVGRLDAEGYLYLTDRVSNMIISGGVNLYPREIEDVLVLHPAVEDVGVIGQSDPDMGERVTAFVQLVPGALAPDEVEGELLSFCRERLSSFKCPKAVVVVESLPRLPSGKLLKRLLQEQVAG